MVAYCFTQSPYFYFGGGGNAIEIRKPIFTTKIQRKAQRTLRLFVFLVPSFVVEKSSKTHQVNDIGVGENNFLGCKGNDADDNSIFFLTFSALDIESFLYKYIYPLTKFGQL